jgi:hypothetical protein
MRRKSSERTVNITREAAHVARKARTWRLARRVQSGPDMKLALVPLPDDASTLNARILDDIDHAAVSTRYRLSDFVSARGRHDLAAMHRFFARRLQHDAAASGLDIGAGAAEVLGALEDLLSEQRYLRPYLCTGTPPQGEYLRDIAELALAVAATLGAKIC